LKEPLIPALFHNEVLSALKTNSQLLLISGIALLLTFTMRSPNMTPPIQATVAATEPGTEDPLSPGHSAPDFALLGLDGQQHRLQDFRGKRLILNFWATWCAPCRKEMPLLDETYKRLEQSGYLVIGINQREKESVARAYVKELGISFPILLDSDVSTSLDYDAFALPLTYFIDENGIIRGRSLGTLTPETLQQYLALFDSVPTPQATGIATPN
jgi:peroxiredoxin